MFDEMKKGVESVVEYFGNKGLWVMDRGFDSLHNFIYFNQLGIGFLIRGFRDRWVEEVYGKKEKLLEIIGKKELRGIDHYYHYYTSGSKNRRRS